MSRRPTRKRELSEDERRLWEQAMRDTTVLRSSDRGAALPTPAEDGRQAARRNRTAQDQIQPKPPSTQDAPPAPTSLPSVQKDISGGSPVTQLGRRETRRIVRDPESIDARLDLHGMRQREAYPALKGFLRASQARGHRLVLVITGKGVARSTPRDEYNAWEATPFYEAPRGVLRRLVPEWLDKAEFRDVVASVSPAHPRHGGEGAVYIRLRRIPPVSVSHGPSKE